MPKKVTINKDAYGLEVWDYYKGKKSYEIVERDDGYFDVSGGAKDYFAEYKDWPMHQKKALRYVKGKVLDVGCGAGRVALWLQKKGFDVTGIDNSPLAIKVCKLRGVKKALLMSIDEIGKFKPNSFDTIVMMGNNFGLFGSFKKAKLLLKKMYRITSPNALIIAESIDPYKTDNPHHLLYHKLNKKRGRMCGQIRIRIIYQKCKSDWFDYLFVSKSEMIKILEGTGWKLKSIVKTKPSPYVAIIEKIS
ncbi:MAG: class I SAM-dependent methyltransferase [Candidatus Aenigmatarchaeota archaeon]